MCRREYESPIGRMILTATDGVITEIKFTGDLSNVSQETPENRAVLDLCTQELNGYFAGELREFTVKIQAAGTSFRERVWVELLKIPYGETISYKQLAQRIGNPAAVRAVGGANHHNPINIIIPCHRVIGANGSLTGYGGGIENKEFLLKLEGISIRQ